MRSPSFDHIHAAFIHNFHSLILLCVNRGQQHLTYWQQTNFTFLQKYLPYQRMNEKWMVDRRVARVLRAAQPAKNDQKNKKGKINLISRATLTIVFSVATTIQSDSLVEWSLSFRKNKIVYVPPEFSNIYPGKQIQKTFTGNWSSTVEPAALSFIIEKQKRHSFLKRHSQFFFRHPFFVAILWLAFVLLIAKCCPTNIFSFSKKKTKARWL